MRIASLSPFLNEERQEISAIDTEGRETFFVRFGRRKKAETDSLSSASITEHSASRRTEKFFDSFERRLVGRE